jgi:hypothetical protein
MKRWLVAAIVGATFALSAAPAPAFFWGSGPCAVVLDWAGYNVYPPGTVFQKQIVTRYYPHWYQQQVPTVVPRTVYKEEVSEVKTIIHVQRVVEEKQTYLAHGLVTRLAEREETTYMMVPIMLVDPAGCPLVTCRPEIRTHKITFPVQEYQPTVKETTVQVTRLFPQEQVRPYRQLVAIVVYDQVLQPEWKCMMIPYQQIVNVPTYDPHLHPVNFWPQ